MHPEGTRGKWSIRGPPQHCNACHAPTFVVPGHISKHASLASITDGWQAHHVTQARAREDVQIIPDTNVPLGADGVLQQN